ncbi:MAG TPA: nucleotidyltransferase family protein [Casimicrobiaceae bacterium]|nr:nucleotidyltransferase family protein [Casimicrobiaceae bacterium]
MKALVLAAGRGNRLEARTAERSKCMLALCGKPLIQYSLEHAVAAGVAEIVVVVGYRAEDIINHFGIAFRGTPIRYVIQGERRGVVHAICCAEQALGPSDFMLFLADEILENPAHRAMLRAFHEEGVFAVCGVVFVEDRAQIRKTYAILGDDATGRIFRLIEKPRSPSNAIMGTGNCILPARIFEYADRTPINAERGERELPDLIQCAVDEGHMVKYFNIGSGYVNINTAEDIELAERLAAARAGAN